MKNKTRVWALTAAVAVAFVLLASSLFVIHNAAHDCCGEDCCPICQQIELCTVHSENFAIAALAALFATAMVWVSRCRAEEPETSFVPGSLVTLKVKLSN